MTEKICILCKIKKQLDSFYVLKTGKDGYTAKCKTCVILKSKERALKNHEAYKLYLRNYGKSWRKLNKDKMKKLLANHYKANKEYYMNKTTIRKLKIKQAFASWDRELTSFVFKEAYRLCKSRKAMTGIEWHIDHVVPLNGETVCGLHVWNNFQVIPAIENLKKGNTYEISRC